MRILISAATHGELKTTKESIKKLGLKKNIEFQYFCSGMGNYETIFSLTNFLRDMKKKDAMPDFIVNIGVCGYIGEKKSLLQVGRIWNLHLEKEFLVPIFLEFAEIESIVCSEKIIKDKEILKKAELNKKNNFIDMESFAVEFVCHKFQIPRMILKVPVDEVGEETVNFDYQKALALLEKNIDWEMLVLKVWKFCNE